MLLTTGLLMLGGGVFVLIYSSTTVWTAVISSCKGHSLAPGRWLGVVLVTLGMVVSSEANFEETKGDETATATLILGWIACLSGTLLHAAMFVYSELAIKDAGIDLLVLCSTMGGIETVVLIIWNLCLFLNYGAELYVSAEHSVDVSLSGLAMLYGALALVNAVHAWAFFHMLEEVGAVSSAVMKGTQLVLVFGFSVVFFCRYQATQCFAWSKAAGVGTVVLGLMVYARSTAREQGGPPQAFRRPAKVEKDEELIQ